MPDGQETAWITLLIFVFIHWFYYRENYTFPRIQRGSNIFHGGGGGGGGGVQLLISIETHITCDFPGGSGSPNHPLGPLLLGPELLQFLIYQLFACCIIFHVLTFFTNLKKKILQRVKPFNLDPDQALRL